MASDRKHYGDFPGGDDDLHGIYVDALDSVGNTTPASHWGSISDARALLAAETPKPKEAHARLGGIPPEVTDAHSLHAAQRWWQVKAEAFIMQRGSDPDAAAECCLRGIDAGLSEIGKNDPNQPLYRATLFCTMAEAMRRAGRLDTETAEALRELAREALSSNDSNYLILAAYAERTLAFHSLRGIKGAAARFSKFIPLSPKFELTF